MADNSRAAKWLRSRYKKLVARYRHRQSIVASPPAASRCNIYLEQLEQRVLLSAPQLITGADDFTKQVIYDAADETHFVAAADLNGDDIPDVVATDFVDDSVFWFEADGNGGFVTRVLDANLDGAYPAHVDDVDLDGDVDVLAAGYLADTFVWYENDGAGGFTRHDIDTATNGPHSIVTVDLDEDGDVDLVTSSQNAGTIAWYENDGSNGFTRHIVDTTATGAKRAEFADIDDDGDLDIITASFIVDEIAWLENDGNENFTKHVIDAAADGAYFASPLDIDDDGDVDVAVAIRYDNTIAWYENLGGGSFTTRHIIDDRSPGARTAIGADIDGDGDVDVLSASVEDDTIAWHINDGSGNFTPHWIDLSADGAYGVYAFDMDRDGDLDVLSAGRDDNTIALYSHFKAHTASVAFGGTLVINDSLLLTIDADDGPLDLIYTLTDAPDFGEIRLNGTAIVGGNTFTQDDVDNNRLAYVHTGGDSSPDSFEFTVQDGGENGVQPATGTFGLTIGAGGNQAPVALDDSYSTPEDTALVVAAVSGVLSNDTDADLDPLNAVLVSDVSNGVLTLNADGSFDYTPNANFNGADSFTYWANDGLANSNLATVTLTVNSENDAPVALDDGYTTSEDTTLVVAALSGVLSNDTDVDLDPLSAVLVDDVSSGVLALNADGSFDYTPNTGFTGTDSFTYRANDGLVNSNLATVTLTVNVQNNAPVALDDGYATSEDTPLSVAALSGVLSNDTDADLDPLSAVLVDDVTNGVLTLNADGSFDYTPNANFNGADSFTYWANDGLANSNLATVTLTVNSENDAPVALDDGYTTSEDTTLVVAALSGVLSNDTDVDLDPLSAVLVDDVSSGVLALNADGSFDYTPNTGFTGTDSFTYRANDGLVNSNLATVTLTVTGADPDLLVALPLDEGSGTVAGDASGMGNDGILVDGALFESNTGDGSSSSVRFDGVDDYIDLGVIDVAGSGLTLAAWFNADSFPGSSNDPRFISKASGVGSNDHIFMLGTIRSGSSVRLRARVRVGGSTTTLIADSGNLATGVWQHAAVTYDGAMMRLFLDGVEVGSQALTGAVAVDPTVSVAVGSQPPGAGQRYFNGLLDDVRILQRAMSQGELAQIVSGNQSPVALDDGYATSEDTPLSVAAVSGVLSNDTDADLDPLNAVLVSDVSNGVLTLNADGSFDYTPNANFNGADSFTYWANDGLANSNLATVTLTVNSENDAPVALDDGYTTSEDTTLVVAALSGVLSNDTDVDLDPLSAVLVDDVSSGVLALNADGSFDYTPNTGFTGTDSFTYRANDGLVNSNLATVTLTVNVQNNAPVALDDGYATSEDTPLSVAALSGVLSNDTDADLDPLSAVLVDDVTNGVLTLNADGSFDYTPNANFNGADSFTYWANDGLANSNLATVTLTVNSENDAPVALDDGYTTSEDTTLVVAALSGVLSNDTDVDLDPLSAVLVDDVSSGVLALNADGSFDYTPNTGFTGTDSFTYRANDGLVNSNLATVTLTVTNGQPPVSSDELVAHWTFDETSGTTASDTSPFGADHVGTLQGDATWSSQGAIGGALSLDGVNDYVTVADSADINTSRHGQRTISAWFQVTDKTISSRKQVVYEEGGTGRGLNIYIHNGNLYVSIWDTSGSGGWTETFLSTDQIQSGQWHHVALVLDGSQTPQAGAFTGYLDGTSFGVGTAAEIGAHGDNTAIGRIDGATRFHDGNSTSNQHGFAGLIDDTRIYNRSLSAQEVQQLAQIVSGNQSPVALDDGYATSEDTPLSVAALSGVLSNDTDADLDPLSAVLVDDVTNGVLTLNADGSFDYTPNANFNGADSFTYWANDGLANSNLATVTLTVNSENDAPVALDDGYTTSEDTTLVVAALSGVLSNDTDVDLDPLSAVLVDDVSSGVLALNADGSFDYTPNTGFTGTDSFTYRANDGLVNSNLATVTLTVTNGQPPVSSDELVAHWTFDETSGTTASDTSPFGADHVGTLQGDATWSSQGAIGGALSLDGVNDYVTVADSADINTSRHGQRTISAWFQVTDKTISSRKQVVYEEGGTGRGLNIYIHNGNLYVSIWDTSGSGGWTETFLSTDQIQSGQWHHVALVLDGSQTPQAGAFTGYLDGTSFGVGTAAEIGAHGDNTAIGRIDGATRFHDGNSTSNQHGFAGLIDDTRIYNRSLSAQEVQQLASQ